MLPPESKIRESDFACCVHHIGCGVHQLPYRAEYVAGTCTAGAGSIRHEPLRKRVSAASAVHLHVDSVGGTHDRPRATGSSRSKPGIPLKLSFSPLSHDRPKLASLPKRNRLAQQGLRLLAPKNCPYCDSLNVRRSHFQSQDEAEGHAFTSPYRCDECFGRFFVLSRKTRYAMIGLFAFLIASATIFLLPTGDPPLAVPAEHAGAASVSPDSAA